MNSIHYRISLEESAVKFHSQPGNHAQSNHQHLIHFDEQMKQTRTWAHAISMTSSLVFSVAKFLNFILDVRMHKPGMKAFQIFELNNF